MVIAVAFCELYVRVRDCPAVIVVLSAFNVTVGAGGGGGGGGATGGGGGGAATFFEHPKETITRTNKTRSESRFQEISFISSNLQG